MRIRLGLVVLVVALARESSVPASDRIEADLTRSPYDRWTFRTVPGAPGTKWASSPQGLRGTMPAAKPGRPLMQFESRFTMTGDFEVTADYEITKLPRPSPPPEGKKDWDVSNNIQLSLPSPQGLITMVYRNHRPSGEGVGFFAQAADGTAQSAHNEAKGGRGRLGLRRTGRELVFLAGDESGDLIELGKAPFGVEPVPRFLLELMSLNTDSPLDVTFTRVDVRADRIAYDEPRPREPISPRTIALLFLLVAASGIVVIAWSMRRNRRRADAEPEPTRTGSRSARGSP